MWGPILEIRVDWNPDFTCDDNLNFLYIVILQVKLAGGYDT